MNQDEIKRMSAIIDNANEYFIHNEAILEALRYRSLKKLTATQYKNLCQRNLRGENFDEMVDRLILEEI